MGTGSSSAQAAAATRSVAQLSLPLCNAERGTGGRKRRERVVGGELVRPLQHMSVLLECRPLGVLLFT
jgi:hypothetical protein